MMTSSKRVSTNSRYFTIKHFWQSKFINKFIVQIQYPPFKPNLSADDFFFFPKLIKGRI